MNKIENAAVRRKKMNKEERPLCPSILLPVDCCECKYRYLCSKLDELSKVIDNDYL